jgi:prepilin-type N-terminal cleavage/methylation domain-containing protein
VNDRQAGFTLIELLAGLALMAIVMAALGGMLTTFLGHGMQGVEQIERQQEARWVLDMIVQDIQYATEFRSGAAPNAVIEVVKKDSRDIDVRVRYYLAGADNGNNMLRRMVWIPATAAGHTDDNQVSNPDHGFISVADFRVTPNVVNDDGTQKVNQLILVYSIRRNQGDLTPKTAQTTVNLPNWPTLIP